MPESQGNYSARRLIEDREWRNTLARERALKAAERRSQRNVAIRLFGTGQVDINIAGPGHERPGGPRCQIAD